MPQDLAVLLRRTSPDADPGEARQMSGGEISDKPGTGGGTVQASVAACDQHRSVVVEPDIKVRPDFFG